MRTLLLAAAVALTLPTAATASETGRDWSGAYLGAYAGYGLGELVVAFDDDRPEGTDLDGVTGGGLAGWNLQFGSVVLGLEADVGVTSQQDVVKGTVTLEPPDLPGTYFYTDRFSKSWEAHLRARVGWACGDLLLYATGGVAVAGVKFGYQSIYDQSYDWDSETQLGWTVGGGLDYAIADRFAARLEYLYDDYGSGGYFDGRDEVELTTHTVRLAITYGF